MNPMQNPSRWPLIGGCLVCAGLLVAAYLDDQGASTPLKAHSSVQPFLDLSPLETAPTSEPLVSSSMQLSDGKVITDNTHSDARERAPDIHSIDGNLHRNTSADSNSSQASARSSQSMGTLDESFPTRDELEGMARRAEQRANHELRRLAKSLDLDEDQQDVIFEIIARSSGDFLPVMRIDSDLGEVIEPLLESTETVEEAIEAVLDEEMAARYVEQNEERRQWWWTTLRDFIPDEELPEAYEESESYVP
ncbi:MAG: hypothetical protein R3F19_26680 [Verrucomicrobiales bacterium]